MKLKLQFLFAFIVSLTYLQAQEVSVNTSMGVGYSDQVYYKLSSQAETVFTADVWDVAFYRASNFDLGVRVNDGISIQVYEVANTPEGYGTVDVTDQSAWSKLHNDDTTWNNGAFMNTSLTGPLAFGFGTYDPENNTVVGDIVFVLKYPDGSYKKFFIETYASGYTFKFSSWDGSAWSADTNVTIPNSNNQNNIFNYYSLQSQSEVIAEPAASDWDFIFRKYDTFLNQPPPGQYYNVAGVLHNPNIEVAENDEPNGIPANPDLTYSDDINTIGYDWKAFGTSGFVVNSDRAFYIKYTDNTIYRLTFTAFSGSSSGDLSFVFNDVTTSLSIEGVSENVSFGIYPNPSADKQINLIYDVNTLNTTNNNVAIYSTTGQMVFQSELKSNSGFYNKSLDLSSLSGGVYILKFTSGEFTTTKKIILN
jgi:hypothetical protein